MSIITIQLLTFLVTVLVISLAALLAFLITTIALVRPEPDVAKSAINGMAKTLHALVAKISHHPSEPQTSEKPPPS